MYGHHNGNGGGSLTAPVRNRFFYGKLMDVRHFELEQRYFLQMRRLMNRLGHGVGVVSGLAVEPTDDGRLIVRPGLAIDDRGREILVTSSVCVERPLVPTDPCGDGDQDPIRDDWLTLLLCYHECDAEPAPVLVSDCDTREECRPGVVRERFRLEIRQGRPDRPAGLTAEQCAAVFPSSPAKSFDRRVAACDALAEPFDPGGDACVVLATVHAPGDGERLIVDECGYRTTVYSNATLFDLLLCLAARVDDCCGRRPETEFTTIRGVWPPNAVELSNMATAQVAGWTKRWVANPAVEVTFSDAVAPPDDAGGDPAAWLRLWVFGLEQGDVEPVVRGIPVPLTFESVTQDPELGIPGYTLRYRLQAAQEGPQSHVGGMPNIASVFNRAAELDEPVALRVLIQIRSGDSGAQLVDGDGDLVDADFTGTKLSQSQLDDIWDIVPGDDVGQDVWEALVDSGERLPESGDGDEGGGLHSTFSLVIGPKPQTGSPPVVRSHWPGNAAVLGPSEGTPRLELIFDRQLAPALLDPSDEWLGLWLVQPHVENTVIARRLRLSLGSSDDPPFVFGDVEGVRAGFDVSPPEIFDEAGRFLVMIRSRDGRIADTNRPSLELDADFVGTKLTPEMIEAMWKVGELAKVVDNEIWDALLPTEARLSPLEPGEAPGESGDGDEGGDLHLTFNRELDD